MPPDSTVVTERPRVPLPVRPRSILARFSLAHGLMALSALLTFVLIASATGEKGAPLRVAVARGDIAAGTTITPALVERVDLSSKSALAGRMVSLERIAEGKWVATRSIGAGDPLRLSDLAPAGARQGLRAMSIPVKRENAAGGSLSVGDRLDVITTATGQAQWVVSGVQVIGVAPSASSGGLTRDVTSGYYVVVEVDADQALALAGALAGQKIEVVRSTGAAAIARPTPAATAPPAAQTPSVVTPVPPENPPSTTAPAPAPGSAP